MPNKITTIVGVFSFEQYRSQDSDFIIGRLDDKTIVVGDSPSGDLVCGLEYEFQGVWDVHPKFGRQFKFRGYSQKAPHSRESIITYLTRYMPARCGMGPVAIRKLVDEYGDETLSIVRSSPASVRYTCPRVTTDQAHQVSKAFHQLDAMESTKVNLISLFAGRAFRKTLVDDCIARWGIGAHKIIKDRPFLLLAEGMNGCGFGLVDRLYCDLGHPLDDSERQMFCVWHVVKKDMSGSTWLPAEMVCNRLMESITGTAANPVEAIKAGVAEGWLATRLDGDGKRWIADAGNAANEETLARYLR